MKELLNGKKGEKVILLGNDAVVRGALESGVEFVSTYPGTPASEVGNTFYSIYKQAKVHFEYSTNEKTAMEAAIGSSMSGLKTLVAMKNFGVNVASESLLPLLYTGTKGPLVMLVADDPECWSSAQSEENSRGFAFLGNIPILEPSDPQECKDFVKLGFEISKKIKLPVIVRTTTRVSHQKAIVELSGYSKNKKLSKGVFVRDRHKWVTIPPRVLDMHKELLEKLEVLREDFNSSNINVVSGKKGPAGIITSGVSYLHVKEALDDLGLKIPVLKLGTFFPFPNKKVGNFIKDMKKVLVVEELDPYIEREVTIVSKDLNPKLKIQGKDLLSSVGEMKPELVKEAIAKFTGTKYSLKLKEEKLKGKRYPQLCPGCPYWLTLTGLKKAVNHDKVVWGGDIGCYMLAGFPPHEMQDFLYSMGSGIGIGHGIKKATGQQVISFIGDSTFYHAGIPALTNAVYNRTNPLIVIFNNEITGMTGHQPHPSSANAEVKVDIEKVVRALGVKNVKVIDPIDQKDLIATTKDFLKNKEVSVIIARRQCIFIKKKQL
jgi:indolepyruvate ferredoxin oxidoreductase alpha subunit